MKYLLGLLLIIGLSACGDKKTDFVYKDNPTYGVSKNYKLLETSVALKSPKVDILWVIDNSGSMDPYQQAVIKNTNSFMNNFTKGSIDWKMGLISTSDYEDPYVGFTALDILDKSTANPVGVFQKAVGRLGTWGDVVEKFFDPTLKALKNYSFLRSDAFLAMIVISDEPEQSNISASTFYSELSKLKDPSKMLLYGIFATYDIPGIQCSGGFAYNTSEYNKIMQTMNGTLFDLCGPDFGTTLSSLGQNLAQKIAVLSSRIVLEDRPLFGTISLTYKGQVLPPGPSEQGGVWTYDPIYNVIVIHDNSVIDQNVKDILVQYKVDPDVTGN